MCVLYVLLLKRVIVIFVVHLSYLPLAELPSPSTAIGIVICFVLLSNSNHRRSCSVGGGEVTSHLRSVITPFPRISTAYLYLSFAFFLYIIFQSRIGFASHVVNGTNIEILYAGIPETNAAKCPGISAKFASLFFSTDTVYAATRLPNTNC